MLAMIDGTDPDWSARTLNYCCRGLAFAEVRLWSWRRPAVPYDGTFVEIPRMEYRAMWAWFVRHWPRQVPRDTEFVLAVHKDGFVLNPERWSDEFLAYDYIGPPWPQSFGLLQRVGGGGFSLRSRRFLDAMAAHGALDTHPEDLFFCVRIRPQLERLGLRFAPVDVACRFALEYPVEETPADDTVVFGFHALITPARRELAARIQAGAFDDPARAGSRLP